MQTRQQSQIWVGKAAPKLKGTVVHLEVNEPTNYTLGGVEEKKKKTLEQLLILWRVKQEPVDMITEELECLVEVEDDPNNGSSGQSNQEEEWRNNISSPTPR